MDRAHENRHSRPEIFQKNNAKKNLRDLKGEKYKKKEKKKKRGKQRPRGKRDGGESMDQKGVRTSTTKKEREVRIERRLRCPKKIRGEEGL